MLGSLAFKLWFDAERIGRVACMVKRKRAAPPDNRVAVIVLKDSREYRDWFNSLSDATLIDAATMVRDALAKWAEARGLPAPPAGSIRPRRKKTS
jgi:hypothetical protein